eukprot:3130332-Amphidinium_carterae.3
MKKMRMQCNHGWHTGKSRWRFWFLACAYRLCSCGGCTCKTSGFVCAPLAAGPAAASAPAAAADGADFIDHHRSDTLRVANDNLRPVSRLLCDLFL